MKCDGIQTRYMREGDVISESYDWCMISRYSGGCIDLMCGATFIDFAFIDFACQAD